jgi:glycine cleavage system regulatory protein
MPRKLIRTGQVSLEVKSTPAAVEAIQRLAAELGGYVAESRAVRQDGDRQAGSLTLRVPAERFAQAVSGLKSLGKVVNESTSTQDVTKAYTDLETRLRVKREAAARVQEILKTRTARLSDVLEAERELARLTEEIEQMEGERRFYDQQIAMSTIAVEVHEPAPVLASSKLAPIGEALSASLEVLAGSVAALIFAVVALVPWLLVALVSWRVIRWARRRRKPSPPPAA